MVQPSNQQKFTKMHGSRHENSISNHVPAIDTGACASASADACASADTSAASVVARVISKRYTCKNTIIYDSNGIIIMDAIIAANRAYEGHIDKSAIFGGKEANCSPILGSSFYDDGINLVSNKKMSLTFNDIQLIGKRITNNTGIELLNLSGSLKETHLIRMITYISNSNITYLDISNNNIDNSYALYNKDYDCYIYNESIDYVTTNFHYLIDALIKCGKIKYLNISSTNIREPNNYWRGSLIKDLERLLKLTPITNLDISRTDITNNDLSRLVPALINSKITTFKYGMIGESSPTYLIKFINKTNITSLDISEFLCVDNFVDIMCQFLPDTKLTKLNINCFNMTNTQITKIAKVLPYSKIRDLTIETFPKLNEYYKRYPISNLISQTGCYALIDCIRRTRVTKLTLDIGLKHNEKKIIQNVINTELQHNINRFKILCWKTAIRHHKLTWAKWIAN